MEENYIHTLFIQFIQYLKVKVTSFNRFKYQILMMVTCFFESFKFKFFTIAVLTFSCFSRFENLSSFS